MTTAPSNLTAVIGIDPGLKGCAAFMIPDIAEVRFLEPRSKQIKSLCSNTVAFLQAHGGTPGGTTGEIPVYFEKCLAYPPMGLKSAFNFGRGVQALYDAFSVVGYDIIEVEPKVWQKPFGLSKNKELTEAFVRKQLVQSYPASSHEFKKGYGYFDAFTIGLYALKFIHQVKCPAKWKYQIIR